MTHSIWPRIAAALVTICALGACAGESSGQPVPTTQPPSPAPTTSPSPTPSPSPQPQTGYGLFLAIRDGDAQSYVPGTSNAYVTFLPDGTILRGLPVEGPLAYVPGSGQVPDYGSYRFSQEGNSASITWSGGDVVTVEFDGSNHFALYDADYAPLDALDDVSLNGVYARASGGAGRMISFTQDGAFDDSGVATDTGLLGTNYPSGQGHYRVQANTLILTYDGGEKNSLSIYALPQAGPQLSSIVLSGFVFESR